MYAIIIIIVYMYLIGNGMLIRRVYVWYRDLVHGYTMAKCTVVLLAMV